MNHDEKKIEEEKLREVIFLALGETSALFMKQDTRGRFMVMPSEKLGVIGDRIFDFAKQYAEHIVQQDRERIITSLRPKIENFEKRFLGHTGIHSKEYMIEFYTRKILEKDIINLINK